MRVNFEPRTRSKNIIVTVLSSILHFWRTIVTLFFFKVLKHDFINNKSSIQKILDFTFFSDEDYSSFYYPKVKYYQIKDPMLGKELLKMHRNHPDVYVGNKSMRSLLDFAKKLFDVDDDISPDSSIFTCSSDMTILYHEMIAKFMNNEQNKVIIMNVIDQMFKNKKADLFCEDSKEFVDEYVSKVFTTIFFGVEYKDFGCYTNKLNTFIIDNRINFIKKKIPDDIRLFFKNFVAKIEADNPDLFPNLSDVERRIMIFNLLFAGLETTSNFLTYAMWKLCRMTQDERAGLIVRDFIDSVFGEFMPAFAIGRTIAHDCTMVYNEKKIDLDAGQSTGVKLYPSMKFGYGPHKCPGRKLAMLEIEMLLDYVVKNYSVSTKCERLEKRYAITQLVTTRYTIEFTSL